jgi:hypothetical protein
MTRDMRQGILAHLVGKVFGANVAAHVPERGARFLEEAIEAAQSAGVPYDMAHALVDRVFNKDPGELNIELGQVGLTLLALANAAGVSADELEREQVARFQNMSRETLYQSFERKIAAGLSCMSHWARPAPGSLLRPATKAPVVSPGEPVDARGFKPGSFA